MKSILNFKILQNGDFSSVTMILQRYLFFSKTTHSKYCVHAKLMVLGVFVVKCKNNVILSFQFTNSIWILLKYSEIMIKMIFFDVHYFFILAWKHPKSLVLRIHSISSVVFQKKKNGIAQYIIDLIVSFLCLGDGHDYMG